MEARNSAGAISAICSANKSGVRSKRVNHAWKKHGKKETRVFWTEPDCPENRTFFISLSLFFFPSFARCLSLSTDGSFEGSFSWNVDSRPLSKVAVSRWIICELEEPLSVRVSEVSMAARARPLPTLDCGELNHKLKLYGFDGRKEYIPWLVRVISFWEGDGIRGNDVLEFVAPNEWGLFLEKPII